MAGFESLPLRHIPIIPPKISMHSVAVCLCGASNGLSKSCDLVENSSSGCVPLIDEEFAGNQQLAFGDGQSPVFRGVGDQSDFHWFNAV